MKPNEALQTSPRIADRNFGSGPFPIPKNGRCPLLSGRSGSFHECPARGGYRHSNFRPTPRNAALQRISGCRPTAANPLCQANDRFTGSAVRLEIVGSKLGKLSGYLVATSGFGRCPPHRSNSRYAPRAGSILTLSSVVGKGLGKLRVCPLPPSISPRLPSIHPEVRRFPTPREHSIARNKVRIRSGDADRRCR